MVDTDHKVPSYIEYRAVSGVFRTIDPQPPLHPRTKGGGGGGSIFRKTPDIGLASYSIIPLRSRLWKERVETPYVIAVDSGSL